MPVPSAFVIRQQLPEKVAAGIVFRDEALKFQNQLPGISSATEITNNVDVRLHSFVRHAIT